MHLEVPNASFKKNSKLRLKCCADVGAQASTVQRNVWSSEHLNEWIHDQFLAESVNEPWHEVSFARLEIRSFSCSGNVISLNFEG